MLSVASGLNSKTPQANFMRLFIAFRWLADSSVQLHSLNDHWTLRELVRPVFTAAFRLTINSNFVGCLTVRSALGDSCRILPAHVVARLHKSAILSPMVTRLSSSTVPVGFRQPDSATQATRGACWRCYGPFLPMNRSPYYGESVRVAGVSTELTSVICDELRVQYLNAADSE